MKPFRPSFQFDLYKDKYSFYLRLMCAKNFHFTIPALAISHTWCGFIPFLKLLLQLCSSALPCPTLPHPHLSLSLSLSVCIYIWVYTKRVILTHTLMGKGCLAAFQLKMTLNYFLHLISETIWLRSHCETERILVCSLHLMWMPQHKMFFLYKQA